MTILLDQSVDELRKKLKELRKKVKENNEQVATLKTTRDYLMMRIGRINNQLDTERRKSNSQQVLLEKPPR